jgi:hypothetical protein
MVQVQEANTADYSGVAVDWAVVVVTPAVWLMDFASL